MGVPSPSFQEQGGQILGGNGLSVPNPALRRGDRLCIGLALFSMSQIVLICKAIGYLPPGILFKSAILRDSECFC